MEFLQFSQLLFDRQLLASEATVREVLNKYHLAVANGHEYIGITKRDPRILYDPDSQIYKGADGQLLGILQVKGALVYESTDWEALCGMTSYEGLQSKAEYMIKEKGVKHLILELNSGGGMAYGCFETAQYVKNLAKENGVKITSYVDGVAYSGGYAWCCIADEVIVNPMGKVGSIGVVLPLVNTSEMDKKEGIKRIYITAGKSKVPFDEDGNFTKEALDDIQDSVMATYDMFVEHVADMRNITTEAVMNTEAKTFGTDKALQLGLIDQVMTKENFYKHLGNFNGDSNMSINITTPKTEPNVESENTNGLVVSQLTSQNAALELSVKNLTSERDQAVSALSLANTENANLKTQLTGLETEIKAAIFDSRKEVISALVADDEVDEHLDFVADFDTDKFNKYKEKLSVQKEKMSTSFKPQGADVQDNEQEKLSVEDRITKRIRERKEKQKA